MQSIILKPFLYNETLKFSDIEKATKIRSNLLSYHLQNLVREGVLTKSHEYYTLSQETERRIPHVSEKEAALPVILIHIENEAGDVVLIERKKRPFKGKIGLPGGRLLAGESFADATRRIGRKWGLGCYLEAVESVHLEHVVKNDDRIHSFVLFLVSAKTTKKLNYTNLEKHKDLIITSDYKLLTTRNYQPVLVEELFTNS